MKLACALLTYLSDSAHLIRGDCKPRKNMRAAVYNLWAAASPDWSAGVVGDYNREQKGGRKRGDMSALNFFG